MKFPVLWLASVSLSVWVGTEKGVRLAWDLVSRSRITLHFGAKAVKRGPCIRLRRIHAIKCDGGSFW